MKGAYFIQLSVLLFLFGSCARDDKQTIESSERLITELTEIVAEIGKINTVEIRLFLEGENVRLSIFKKLDPSIYGKILLDLHQASKKQNLPLKRYVLESQGWLYHDLSFTEMERINEGQRAYKTFLNAMVDSSSEFAHQMLKSSTSYYNENYTDDLLLYIKNVSHRVDRGYTVAYTNTSNKIENITFHSEIGTQNFYMTLKQDDIKFRIVKLGFETKFNLR